MAATRERLEAVIWTRAPELLCADQNCRETAMDDILKAVDEYVSAEVGLLTPAERRRVIEAAP
jgi:hypothetical protein